MALPNERYKTFREFWPYYLSEHSKVSTRRLHFIGTTCAFLALIALIATRDIWFLPLALVAGYGPAWFAHFQIEKNRPATFTYPVWSLFADFKMWFYILTRREFK